MFQYFGSHSFSNFIVTDIITHAGNLTILQPIKGEHISFISDFILHPFLILKQHSITFKYMKRCEGEDICNTKTMACKPQETTHRQYQTVFNHSCLGGKIEKESGAREPRERLLQIFIF